MVGDSGMSRIQTRLIAVAMLSLTFAAVAVTPASAQCAMCRTLLQTPEGQQMAAAFRSGILLLLAAPFSIFGLIAALAVRSHRRRADGKAPGQRDCLTENT